MAISTNALIEFFGTPDDVTNASNGTIAADAMSVAADIDSWTNDDDAPEAVFVLKYTSSSAPAAGGWVTLMARMDDVQSTNDESVPTASDQSAHILGRFRIPNATSSFSSLRARLPNAKASQVYEFFILNKTNQTMTNTWELHVTPVTVGPHA